MPRKNRARTDLPPTSGVGLGGNKGVPAGTFKPADIATIVAEVGHPSEMAPELMAANLDVALTLYLGNFATAADGAPSEKEKWAANLRTAAEDCLEMIASGFASKNGRLLSVDRRAYSHLFSFFPDEDAHVVLQPIELRDGESFVDALRRHPGLARGRALDDIARGLAQLREIADLAAKGWASRKGETTNKVAEWRLSWVNLLAPLYAIAFRLTVPLRPSPTAPFVRFCEAVRMRALAYRPISPHVDAAAWDDLAEFTAGSLVSFMRREGKAGTLRGPWVPDPTAKLGYRF